MDETTPAEESNGPPRIIDDSLSGSIRTLDSRQYPARDADLFGQAQEAAEVLVQSWMRAALREAALETLRRQLQKPDDGGEEPQSVVSLTFDALRVVFCTCERLAARWSDHLREAGLTQAAEWLQHLVANECRSSLFVPASDAFSGSSTAANDDAPVATPRGQTTVPGSTVEGAPTARTTAQSTARQQQQPRQRMTPFGSLRDVIAQAPLRVSPSGKIVGDDDDNNSPDAAAAVVMEKIGSLVLEGQSYWPRQHWNLIRDFCQWQLPARLYRGAAAERSSAPAAALSHLETDKDQAAAGELTPEERQRLLDRKRKSAARVRLPPKRPRRTTTAAIANTSISPAGVAVRTTTIPTGRGLASNGTPPETPGQALVPTDAGGRAAAYVIVPRPPSDLSHEQWTMEEIRETMEACSKTSIKEFWHANDSSATANPPPGGSTTSLLILGSLTDLGHLNWHMQSAVDYPPLPHQLDPLAGGTDLATTTAATTNTVEGATAVSTSITTLPYLHRKRYQRRSIQERLGPHTTVSAEATTKRSGAARIPSRVWQTMEKEDEVASLVAVGASSDEQEDENRANHHHEADDDDDDEAPTGGQPTLRQQILVLPPARWLECDLRDVLVECRNHYHGEDGSKVQVTTLHAFASIEIMGLDEEADSPHLSAALHDS